jgi:predicted transcriptional regulator
MVKMMFCGVDLAWSPKNATGITILEGDKDRAKHISSKIVFSDQEIIEHIKEKVADSHAEEKKSQNYLKNKVLLMILILKNMKKQKNF